MRKNKRTASQNDFSVLILDDEPIMTETLKSFMINNGYEVDTENDPITAIESVKEGSYDILILDYLMTPITGDQVVERIRLFNEEIFIILLTGHRDLVPPVRTIRSLDIQGYCEKGDSFDQLEMLVESCAKSIKQMRTIRKYQKGLTDMAEQMPDINSLSDPEEICQKIASTADTLWGGGGTLVALDPPKESGKPVRVEHGKSFGVSLNFTVDTLAERVLAKLEGEQVFSSMLRDSAGKNIGFMVVRTTDVNDTYDKHRFSIFVRQCSSAAENAFLAQRVKNGYFDLIQAIRLMVDARDETTSGHSDRVSILSAKMAKLLGCDPQTVENIKLAGLFHDIGKVGVPDSILLSQGKLTPEEYEEIQKHSGRGADMLSAIPTLAGIAPIVRAHHERVDGTGYPDKLTGDKIPLEAKIIAVVDVFDAMTSQRTYSNGVDVNEAITRLKQAKGTQLDAKITDLLISLIKNDYVNLYKEESHGIGDDR